MEQKGDPDDDYVSDLNCGQRTLKFFSNYYQSLVVLLTPLITLPLLILKYEPPIQCLFVVINMAVFWITEAVPLPVTSLLPIVAFPLFGIMTSANACALYFSDTVVMFICGIMVALAIEYCNLHKRVALKFIILIGCSMRRLHFGLTVITMFISMWISNSAATAMMCPIILAILTELESEGLCKIYRDDLPEDTVVKKGEEKERVPTKITVCYFLSTAYGATIGGCGTLIGTGTNLVFKGIYEKRFPDGPQVNFFSFLCYSLPPTIVNTLLMILFMQWHLMGLFRPKSHEAKLIKQAKIGTDLVNAVVRAKYNDLGPISQHEIGVLVLFILMIIAYFTKSPDIFPGWGKLFPKKIGMSTPTAIILFMLFVIPANWSYLRFFWSKRVPKKRSGALLTWSFVHQKCSWGLLFLLGSGFALAEAIKLTGLAEMISTTMKPLKILPLPLVILVVMVLSEFLTTFSTNVGICNIVIPVMAELAVIIHANPLSLIYPAGLACSMGFLLPVSTPPNALVALYARIRVRDMVIAGLGPTIITIGTFFLVSQTTATFIYKDLTSFPEWAHTKAIV